MEKHGIDFEAAQALWADDGAIRIKTGYVREPRYFVIGKIKSIFWTAVITYRNDATRIISVRRSNKIEVVWYEQSQS